MLPETSGSAPSGLHAGFTVCDKAHALLFVESHARPCGLQRVGPISAAGRLFQYLRAAMWPHPPGSLPRLSAPLWCAVQPSFRCAHPSPAAASGDRVASGQDWSPRAGTPTPAQHTVAQGNWHASEAGPLSHNWLLSQPQPCTLGPLGERAYSLGGRCGGDPGPGSEGTVNTP